MNWVNKLIIGLPDEQLATELRKLSDNELASMARIALGEEKAAEPIWYKPSESEKKSSLSNPEHPWQQRAKQRSLAKETKKKAGRRMKVTDGLIKDIVLAISSTEGGIDFAGLVMKANVNGMALKRALDRLEIVEKKIVEVDGKWKLV